MNKIDCIDYKYMWWHFLIPSLDSIKKVCISFDKTEMFLVSLIRTFVYIYLFLIIKDHKQFIKHGIKYGILYGLVTIIIINIIVLVYVILKKQVVAKIDTANYLNNRDSPTDDELLEQILLKRPAPPALSETYFETTH